MEPDLERFVDRFERALRDVRRGERRRAIGEVRDHVLCAAADWQSQGLDRPAALERAISAFGPIDQIAAGYRVPPSRVRLATATGLVLAAAAFAALTFAPTSIIPTSHAAGTTCAGRSTASPVALPSGSARTTTGGSRCASKLHAVPRARRTLPLP
jgi:hypothetical protein